MSLDVFYDGKRKIICIKNTDITDPPPPFQSYQAYDGDEAGILKFINELFVKGTFTANNSSRWGEFHLQQVSRKCGRGAIFWDAGRGDISQGMDDSPGRDSGSDRRAAAGD